MGAAFAAIERAADAGEAGQAAAVVLGSTRAFARRLAVGRTLACVGHGKVGWVRCYRSCCEHVRGNRGEIAI